MKNMEAVRRKNRESKKKRFFCSFIENPSQKEVSNNLGKDGEKYERRDENLVRKEAKCYTVGDNGYSK